MHSGSIEGNGHWTEERTEVAIWACANGATVSTLCLYHNTFLHGNICLFPFLNGKWAVQSFIYF